MRSRASASCSRTEHDLQPDDAGEVVIEIDVVVVISEPQAEQLQEAVVQVHPFMETHTDAFYT